MLINCLIDSLSTKLGVSLIDEFQIAKHIDALQVERDDIEVRTYSFHVRDHNIHIKSVMRVIGKFTAQ